MASSRRAQSAWGGEKRVHRGGETVFAGGPCLRSPKILDANRLLALGWEYDVVPELPPVSGGTRHLPKHLLSVLTLAVVTAAACDRAPTSAIAPKEPAFATNVSTVCKGSSVPTGYVILSYFNSISCGTFGSYPNAMSIGLPASPESVCHDSPIPSGWVISSYGRRSNCDAYSVSSSSFKNTNSIKIPTATYEYVCDDSPIPSNYTTTTYRYYTSSCDRYGEGYRGWTNAREIRKV